MATYQRNHILCWIFLFLLVTVSFCLAGLVYYLFYHKSLNIVGTDVHSVSALTDDFSVFNRALSNILVERVPGSENHAKVQKYIMSELSSMGWTVETDDFTSKVPYFGNINFKNIIASHNPKARRFLDLACHYDSKYFKNFVFLAATDSAVPCSIMIQLASSLTPLLNKATNNELSLRLIFFDGEEAFKTWSPSDSLYGSRHLAKKWDTTPYPEAGGDATLLDRMDMLVLLDLIGGHNPTFYSFFSNTQGWYKVLTNAETKLAQAKLLSNYNRRYFQKMSTDGRVEDDHLPFMERNVPILHLITVPFPEVWHTAADNADAIDMASTMHITKILGHFVAEYLHLSVQ